MGKSGCDLMEPPTMGYACQRGRGAGLFERFKTHDYVQRRASRRRAYLPAVRFSSLRSVSKTRTNGHWRLYLDLRAVSTWHKAKLPGRALATITVMAGVRVGNSDIVASCRALCATYNARVKQFRRPPRPYVSLTLSMALLRCCVIPRQVACIVSINALE